MNVSVLGCGRWGSFIAWYLDKIGHNVIMWGREGSEHFCDVSKNRKNQILTFKDSIDITSDLKKAISSSDVIIISISSQSLRDFTKELLSYDLKGKTIVLCMKGIEKDTGKRLTQVVRDYIQADTKLAVWVGPGHVQDFHNNIPNCMVIDSDDEDTKKFLVKEFSSDLIRFYLGTDLIGSEIGAASKNVIGIAAGMLDGLGYTSLKGALMSRGTREIARLIKAMGGNEMSAYGLAHLGDYQATLFSEYSNNRKFGEMFINGQKFEKLAEGVFTTKALIKLADEYNVDLPICNAVDLIVNKGKDPKKVLSDLFLRSVKKEF